MSKRAREKEQRQRQQLEIQKKNHKISTKRKNAYEMH